MATSVTNENYESLLKAPVAVIDFWATWCGPCQRMTPIIEELAKEYEGKVTIAKCDIEVCDELTEKMGIMSVPTILFLKNGEVVDKQVGATSKEALKTKVDALL